MKHIFLILFVSNLSFSQVGIGTTAPQETLHVNGSARIQNLDSSNPLSNGVDTNVGVDINGTLILTNSIKGKIAPNGNAIKIQGATSFRVNNGDYQITFTTPMLDADYIILLSYSNNGGLGATIISYYNQTTNGFRVKLKDSYWLTDVNVQFMFRVEM